MNDDTVDGCVQKIELLLGKKAVLAMCSRTINQSSSCSCKVRRRRGMEFQSGQFIPIVVSNQNRGMASSIHHAELIHQVSTQSRQLLTQSAAANNTIGEKEFR